MVLTNGEAMQARRSLWDTYDRIVQGTPRPAVPLSRAEWEQAAGGLRETLWRCLGVVPHEPQEPVATLCGSTEFETYTVESLTIETRPDFLVTTNLYIPKGLTQPAPAILCPPGHSIDPGKAAPAYQSLYIGLARKGFVVLALDAIGHGERKGLGHNGMGSPTLIGSSLAGMEIWDNLKCLDVLCARPEVDALRIGCIGNSGGGTQTIWTAALDERIAVAIPSDATTSFAYNHAKERDICFCNLAPQIIPHAEIEHVLGLIAPRPLLLLGGALDRVFPWDLQREVFRRTRRIYALYERLDHIEQFISPDPHSLTRPKREAAYAYFLRHLKGVTHPEAAQEPDDLAPLPSDHPALLCFPNPQRAPKALQQSVNAFVRAEARLLVESRSCSDPQLEQRGSDRGGGVADLRERLRTVLKCCDPLDKSTVRRNCIQEAVGRDTQGSAHIESITLWVDPETPLALTCASPGQVEGVRVFVDRDGKDSEWCRTSAQHAVGQGFAAISVDLRGWGALMPTELSDDGSLDEWVAVQKGIGYDVPLFGLRVRDLLFALDWVAEAFASSPRIELFGHGFASLVALAAAVLSDNVASVDLSELPASFIPPGDRRAHDTLRHEYAFALVPGLIAQVGDVPHLLQALSPRPCRVSSLMKNTEPLEAGT